MKIYKALYAEDVPHYGAREIEAASDAEAIEKARAITPEALSELTTDPHHDDSVCRRLIYIEDDTGNEIVLDHPLDDFRLHHGTEAEHGLRRAAPKLLAALRHIERICAPGIDQSDDDLEAALAGVKTIAAKAIAEGHATARQREDGSGSGR